MRRRAPARRRTAVARNTRQARFERVLVEELTRQLGEFRQAVGEALARHGNQVNERFAEVEQGFVDMAARIGER